MGKPRGENRLSCLICSHKKRNAIEKALIAGQTYRNIARRWRVSTAGISRHKPHIARALTRILDRRDENCAGTLLDKLDRMEVDFRRLSDKAELNAEWPAAIVALKECRETLKLIHEMQQFASRTGEAAAAAARLSAPEKESLDETFAKLFRNEDDERAEALKAITVHTKRVN